MPDNILSAKIQVTAPGVKEVFDRVAVGVGNAENKLKRLPQTANAATQSMINLGRVVQDAPFGFLGIANNLNPLLESFQRLRATTATTGGALRALAASMLGAGGLGFALSIVSSLLIVFGGNLFGAKKKAEETEPVLTSLQKAQKKLREEIEGASKAVISNAGNFEDLKLVLVDVSNQYLTLADSIVKQGIAQLLFSQKEGLIKNLLVKAVENQLKVQKVLNDAKSKEFKIATDLSNVKPIRIASDKEFFSLRENLDGTGKELFDINSLASSLGLNFTQFVKTTKDGKKDVKDISFEFDHLKQIFIDLSGIQKVFSDQLSKDAKVRFQVLADIAGGGGSAFDKFTKEIPKVSSELQKRIDSFNKSNPINIIADVGVRFRLGQAEQLKKDLAAINATIKSALDGAFEGFGEGLGEVLGGGTILSGLKIFVNAIGAGIQAIGKHLIALGTVALAAKLALDTLFENPALMIAAGIALIAVGAALRKSLSGGLKGFAAGGIVRPGEPIIVGERGREVFVPNTGGRIIPNNQVETGGIGIGGGISVRVVGTNILRGQDLVTIFTLANQRQSRLS